MTVMAGSGIRGFKSSAMIGTSIAEGASIDAPMSGQSRVLLLVISACCDYCWNGIYW